MNSYKSPDKIHEINKENIILNAYGEHLMYEDDDILGKFEIKCLYVNLKTKI